MTNREPSVASSPFDATSSLCSKKCEDISARTVTFLADNMIPVRLQTNRGVLYLEND